MPRVSRKQILAGVAIIVAFLVCIGVASLIRSKTSGAGQPQAPMPTVSPYSETVFHEAADATFGAGKYQIKGNGSYEIEFSLDNMWDVEMMVFRFNSRIAEYCHALLQTDRYSETHYSDIEFVGIATVTDLYGNESVQPVARASLDMPTIEKINWDNFNHDNLQQICQKYILSAALQ